MDDAAGVVDTVRRTGPHDDHLTIGEPEHVAMLRVDAGVAVGLPRRDPDFAQGGFGSAAAGFAGLGTAVERVAAAGSPHRPSHTLR